MLNPAQLKYLKRIASHAGSNHPHVLVEGESCVATDGHRMAVMKHPELPEGCYTSRGAVVTDYPFPAWRNVLPDGAPPSILEMDQDELGSLRQLASAFRPDIQPVLEFDGVDRQLRVVSNRPRSSFTQRLALSSAQSSSRTRFALNLRYLVAACDLLELHAGIDLCALDRYSPVVLMSTRGQVVIMPCA